MEDSVADGCALKSRLSGILSSFLSPFRSTPKSSARAAAQASTVKEEASDGEEQHAQYAIGPLGGGDGSAGDEVRPRLTTSRSDSADVLT